MTRDEAIEIVGKPRVEGHRSCLLCSGLTNGCPRSEELCTVEREWLLYHPGDAELLRTQG